jgi:ABC-type uncharacterized transport system substrate-binding protein
MKRAFTPRIILPLLVFVLARPLVCAKVAVVLSDDQPATREAWQAVHQIVPEAQSMALTATSGRLDGIAVIVALGPSAITQAFPASAKLVAALSVDPGLAVPNGTVQVSSLPDAFLFIGKVHDLVPKLQTLAVFTGSGLFQAYIHYLEAAGKVTGVKILVRDVDSPSDVVGALRALPGKAEALWLAPSAVLLGQKNFQFISNYCRNTSVALIAPVPELAGAGALAGVAPSAQDLGRAAGQAAKDLAAGKSVGHTVNADGIRTIINGGVATALGLKVSATDGEIIP